MNSTAGLSPTDLKRIPGLYRRWELTEVFEARRTYFLEEAGRHSDGSPLLAVYVGPVPDDVADLGPGPIALDRGALGEAF